MRKNTARHWLHAALDLLPVILIPVFMIYSHRHDVAQDFQVVEEVPVYYETNEVSNIDDLVPGRYYTLKSDDFVSDNTLQIIFMYDWHLITGSYSNNGSWGSYGDTPYLRTGAAGYSNLLIASQPSENSTTNDDYYLLASNSSIDFIFKSSTNLSSLVDAISECPRQYIKEYQEVITTIPKDVMTSFLDRFNNSIDKYFNMGNVFGMSNVYQWFNTNIFGGNAPTIIFSVWNIVLYEFVMDLIFLLYALFMWFIDMTKRLIEKPMDSIK